MIFMNHELKLRVLRSIRHISFLALATTALMNALPGRADPVDCTLDIKPSGASVGYGRCPLAERCDKSHGMNDCIPEFGAKYDGQFVPAIRQWGTSDIGGLKNPVAVVENPNARGQIWVLNSGGDSISVFYCPRVKSPSYKPEERRDLASCHFMHNPTAIDFGEAPVDGDEADFPGSEATDIMKTGTFLTTGGGCNDYTAVNFMGKDYTKRRCSDFMGPTLWENNLKTFAIRNNDFFPNDLSKLPFGSHLSMIHQQPYAMGAAWDGVNAGYWTWDAGVDSKYGSIVFNSIARTHGYGGHNHNDISLFRYAGTTMSKKSAPGPVIPGHMVKYDKFLFVANPAEGVINILDTKSGRTDGHVKPEREWRERYTTYTSMADAKFTKLDIKGLELETPSGLAISENRLFVSDAATGQIHAIKLDIITGNHTLIGTIETPSDRIAGLTVDKITKRIWFVDSIKHTLSVVEPPCIDMVDCDYTGDSPWGDSCAPDTNENGTTVWQAHLEKAQNHNNWEGCARYYYLECPGGNSHKNSKLDVCYTTGGTWRDADVEWAEGKSTCHCRSSGASQVASNLKLPIVLLAAVISYFNR